MANEKHLLLTCQGDYTDSALAAETWQVGIRLALNWGNVDEVGTLPNTWDPVAASINRTETDWTITGNWKAHQGFTDFNPDDYLNDQAAPAFATWLSAVSGMSSHTRIRALKVYPIGTNGRAVPAVPYATGTPCELTWTGNYPVGSNSGSHLPLQIAAVASHRTSQTGRRGRGRMFLAGLNQGAVGADGLFSSSWCTGTTAAQVALLEALAYTAGVGLLPHVRPIVTGSPYVNYGLITQVRVGNVPDTQRRRRRSLPETYQSGTPTY